MSSLLRTRRETGWLSGTTLGRHARRMDEARRSLTQRRSPRTRRSSGCRDQSVVRSPTFSRPPLLLDGRTDISRFSSVGASRVTDCKCVQDRFLLQVEPDQLCEVAVEKPADR